MVDRHEDWRETSDAEEDVSEDVEAGVKGVSAWSDAWSDENEADMAEDDDIGFVGRPCRWRKLVLTVSFCFWRAGVGESSVRSRAPFRPIAFRRGRASDQQDASSDGGQLAKRENRDSLRN